MIKRELDEMVGLLSDEHLRERISPRYDDVYYLHLSDMLSALRVHATNAKLTILDYGAGISPYRSLFPNAIYKRADFPIGEGEALDFVLNESHTVSAKSSEFDMVLSTQVLEHVEQPELYLKECLRVLQPGGKLVLTTHGIFGDHPCPFDLHRWTADGLAELCKKSGFEIVEIYKLTTDARALFFLYALYGRKTHRRAFSIFSAIFALQFRFFRFFRKFIYRWADNFFSDSRIVLNQPEAKNEIYINILVHAIKPGPKI